MTKKKIYYWVVAQLLISIFISAVALANDNDFIKAVELCDESTLITMQNAGMVAVLKEDVGEDVFQQVTSVAVKLLESGEPTGYFDPGYPTAACGHQNVMTITMIKFEE